MTEFYVPSTQKGAYGNIIAWALGILALVILIAVIVGGIQWITAPASGKLSARRQINSGSYRIAAYDHFFNLCAAVQTANARLDAQAAELATATTADDKARIGANIAGISADRADAINQYNADAAKGYTLGQFRSSQLPYRLDTAAHTKGQATTCAA